MAVTKKTEVKVPTIAEVEALAEEMVTPKKVARLETLEEIAMRIKEDLKGYPLVEIFIPIDEKNPDDKIYAVNLCGYRMQIPKGKRYMVPKPIRDDWDKSYNSSIKSSGMIRSVDANKEDPLANL